MWSHRHNVNLLAAGCNRPKHGYSGSGIFSGKAGALNSVISDKPLTKLVFADVPNIPFQSFSNAVLRQVQNDDIEPPITVEHTLTDLLILNEDLKNFTVRFLNFTRKEDKEEFKGKICVENDNSVCCEYDIRTKAMEVSSSVSQMKRDSNLQLF